MSMMRFNNERTLIWTRFADAAEIFPHFDRLLRELDVRMIAPGHGNVIEDLDVMVPLANRLSLPFGRCRRDAVAPVVSRPVEIVPGRIWALGGYISTQPPRSWLAPESRGWLPVCCYALLDGEHFIPIDTGLVGHAESIRDGLSALVQGTSQRHIMLTRREPDTMMNMPWIVREFAINSVRCCGPIDPFDLVELLEEAHTASDIKAAFGVSVDFLQPESATLYDRMSLTIMRPPIRILATDWMFESATETLFCSDLWAF